MPVTIKFKVDREKFKTSIQKNQEKALQVVGSYMVRELQKVVSVPVKKIQVTRTRDTVAGRAGSTYMKTIERSKPGEPPRLDTGFGRAGIQFRVVRGANGNFRLQTSVAKNAWYMVHLEMNKNRPWLVSTMLKHRDKVESIIAMIGKQA